MATRTLVVLEDDLDGSKATETIEFAFEGTQYTIDLSGRNAEKFRGDMERWIKAAKKVGGRGSRKTNGSAGVDLKAVRAWASSHNIELSSRGRVPARVIEQYRASGN